MTTPWHERLIVRLFVPVAFVVLLSICASLTWVYYIESNRLVDRARTEAALINEVVHSGLHDHMLRNDAEGLQTAIERVKKSGGLRRVSIVNNEGKVTFCTSELERGTTLEFEDRICQTCHATSPPGTETVVDISGEGGHIGSAVSSIPNEEACHKCHDTDDKHLGVLLVTSDFRPHEEAMKSIQKTLVAIGASTIALLALLALLVMHLFVQRPVDLLLEGVRRFQGGELDRAIEIGSGGELGEVGEAVNDLSASVSGQMERIREQNFELSVLYAVVGRLSTTINLLELRGVILDLIVEVFEGVECAAFAFRPLSDGVIEMSRRIAPFDGPDESSVLEMRGGNVVPCAEFPGLAQWARGGYDEPASVETEWDRLIPLEVNGKRIGALFVRKQKTSYVTVHLG